MSFAIWHPLQRSWIKRCSDTEFAVEFIRFACKIWEGQQDKHYMNLSVLRLMHLWLGIHSTGSTSRLWSVHRTSDFVLEFSCGSGRLWLVWSVFLRNLRVNCTLLLILTKHLRNRLLLRSWRRLYCFGNLCTQTDCPWKRCY